MATPGKQAKVNWPLIIWPTLMLWVATVSYLPFSELQGSGMLSAIIPLLLFAEMVIVIALHAVAQSLAQEKLDLEANYGSLTACMSCGRTDAELALIGYEYVLCFGLVMVERSLRGKYCQSCARHHTNLALVAAVLGGVLFPPFIVIALLRRQAALARFHRDLPGMPRYTMLPNSDKAASAPEGPPKGPDTRTGVSFHP